MTTIKETENCSKKFIEFRRSGLLLIENERGDFIVLDKQQAKELIDILRDYTE